MSYEPRDPEPEPERQVVRQIQAADDPAGRILEREAGGSSLLGYALIKYASLVIIAVAILYFLAAFLLPALSAPPPDDGSGGEATFRFFWQ